MNFAFIDDDYSVNYYHKVVLSAIDEELLKGTYFANAEIALKYLMECKPNIYPKAIFLDLHMPEMNGWAFIEQYKLEKLPHTKIIVLTSSKETDDRIKANGETLVFDYILKPIDIEYIYYIMKKIPQSIEVS